MSGQGFKDICSRCDEWTLENKEGGITLRGDPGMNLELSRTQNEDGSVQYDGVAKSRGEQITSQAHLTITLGDDNKLHFDGNIEVREAYVEALGKCLNDDIAEAQP